MARPVDAGDSWMRAACAVHEQQRRVRRVITEMYRASDALVVRMELLGYGRVRDGVLSHAIELRDRLAAEACGPPLLHRWQATFDQMAREERELDVRTDEDLARDVERWGLPEDPSHQLPLRFAG